MLLLFVDGIIGNFKGIHWKTKNSVSTYQLCGNEVILDHPASVEHQINYNHLSAPQKNHPGEVAELLIHRIMSK